MEAPDGAVSIANNEDAFRSDVERRVVAGLLKGAHVCHYLPAGQQDALDFQPSHFRVPVDPGRQGALDLGGVDAVRCYAG
jgi:hypothetical protein